MASVPSNPAILAGHFASPNVASSSSFSVLWLAVSNKKSKEIQVTVECTTLDGIVILGTTEVVQRTETRFATPFLVEHWPGAAQTVRFIIERPGRILKKAVIDVLERPLDVILAAPRGIDIFLASGLASLYVTAEPTTLSNEDLVLHFHGVDLEKKDVLGKSDPYYIISKAPIEGQPGKHLFRSHYFRQDLNPAWLATSIGVSLLGGNDPSQLLSIEVWDYDNPSESDFIGVAQVTLSQLFDAVKTGTMIPLINPKKQASKKNYQDSGKLKILKVGFEPKFSPLNGAQSERLNYKLAVAVDFSYSNGLAESKSSLHEKKTGNNAYQAAIPKVLEILLPFSDGKLDAYGFGGLRKMKSHESFPLKKGQLELNGIAGVMEAYEEARERYQCAGQSDVAEVLKEVIDATETANKQSMKDGIVTYTTLVIFATGQLSPFYPTSSQVIRASTLPISIIIIGIGDHDWRSLSPLQSDNAMLKALGKVATRDIVHFLPFLQHKDSPHRLSSEVLKELPFQIWQYLQHANTPSSSI